ncbi:MAG: phosphatidate cytidylyltransferase [Bacteroidetes bacterium]|nr:phosphatidate cytidylyltransferase [Bacteroidota bacterium]
MALHWPTFFTRLGSAIVFSIIMMVGLLWNVWAFFFLIALIQVLCIHEYFGLMQKMFPENITPRNMVWGVQIFGLLLLLMIARGDHFWMIILFFPALLLLSGLLHKSGSVQLLMMLTGCMVYVIFPLSLLLLLRLISIIIPLALVLMIWMNDTMAYLVGSFIGKTPFSKISPKKTWEGTVGGALLTLIGAAIWGYYTPYYHMVDWMAIGLCASIAGTAGDLFESKLKRLANVKDSGSMMPGHGGALDRFDSLLLATPFAFSYAAVFMPKLSLLIF